MKMANERATTLDTTFRNIQDSAKLLGKAVAVMIVIVPESWDKVSQFVLAHWGMISPMMDSHPWTLYMVATLMTMVTCAIAIWISLLLGVHISIWQTLRPFIAKDRNSLNKNKKKRKKKT
jgi:hypothetical protein